MMFRRDRNPEHVHYQGVCSLLVCPNELTEGERMAEYAAAVAADKCFGAEDEFGNPTCDGPDIQRVYVLTGEAQSFETYWCAECRGIAIGDGWTVSV